MTTTELSAQAKKLAKERKIKTKLQQAYQHSAMKKEYTTVQSG
jgi:hypothetical protein